MLNDVQNKDINDGSVNWGMISKLDKPRRISSLHYYQKNLATIPLIQKTPYSYNTKIQHRMQEKIQGYLHLIKMVCMNINNVFK